MLYKPWILQYQLKDLKLEGVVRSWEGGGGERMKVRETEVGRCEREDFCFARESIHTARKNTKDSIF